MAGYITRTIRTRNSQFSGDAFRIFCSLFSPRISLIRNDFEGSSLGWRTGPHKHCEGVESFPVPEPGGFTYSYSLFFIYCFFFLVLLPWVWTQSVFAYILYNFISENCKKCSQSLCVPVGDFVWLMGPQDPVQKFAESGHWMGDGGWWMEVDLAGGITLKPKTHRHVNFVLGIASTSVTF